MSVTQVVRVGVACVVKNPKTKTVLIGQRKGSHGASKIQLPGGHLEFGEEWNQCVEREVMEETGLSVSHIKLFAVTNDIMITTDNKHYITIFMTCETTDPDQEPENRESHKNEFWKWINWSDLRSGSYNDRLFLPLQHLVFREDQPDPFVEQQNLLN